VINEGRKETRKEVVKDDKRHNGSGSAKERERGRKDKVGRKMR
jgi:hypothetical protein